MRIIGQAKLLKRSPYLRISLRDKYQKYMKHFKKTIFALIILFLWITPSVSFAVTFELITKSNNYQQGSEFYIDVAVEPNGQSINGVDGELVITNANVLRIEDGGSIVKNWITRPVLTGKDGSINVNFSGIIPNGFNGYLNSIEKGGLVFRVVLKAKNEGLVNLNLKNLMVTKNDGEGSPISVKNQTMSIKISNTGEVEKYTAVDNERPEVNYEIVTDPNLFDGKKTLVFSAIDSKSGLKDVYIKEGFKDFRPADSPYLLEDQSLRGIILLKVTDNAGNETLVKIKPTLAAYLPNNSLVMLILVILIFIIGVFYIKNKNNKQNEKSK